MERVHLFQPHDEIRAQARRWVLTFNGDEPPTDDDIAALREWAARSPAHRRELERAQAFWSDADLLSELAVPTVADKARQYTREKARETAREKARVGKARDAVARRFRPGRPGLAAACVLCIATALALWVSVPANKPVPNGLYATRIGEQKTLTLPDRSRIHLDTNSEVRVDYSNAYRELRLLRGKAYFEVAKNPERPFEVYAGEGLVRAVGTAFSVYLVEKNVEVTVSEGKVALARLDPDAVTPRQTGLQTLANTRQKTPTQSTGAGQPAAAPPRPVAKTFRTLEMGQSATFDLADENIRHLDEKELSRDLAWRDGVLIFTAEPLRQVIAEVNRYTTTRIEVTDPALGDLLIGGRFKVGKLEALFDVLETGFDVRVSYVDDNHVKLQPAP